MDLFRTLSVSTPTTLNGKVYGFKHPNSYRKYIVRPGKKVNKKRIFNEEDNVQRILASLLRKEVTQSVIIKKLNSFSNSNHTKKALWELNGIYMTLHLLECIDNPVSRQHIQRSLNRGESYHALRRAIAFMNESKFRGSSIRELEIWNECARLIANCIVLFNSIILSGVLEYYKGLKIDPMVQQFSRISPYAWDYINFIGMYSFRNYKRPIDINMFVKKIINSIEK